MNNKLLPKQMNTYNIIITGKVQDIGFRSIIENIGRSFGMPGFVFNAKDGSVKILCSGDDSVIDNFTQTIKVRGAESGAEIVDIKEQLLPFIDLPDNFSKASSDDDIDIGRKLDKANLLLKSVNTDLNTGFNNLNTDLNTGFNNLNTDLNTGFNNLTDVLGSFIGEQRVYNRGQQGHNTRLESILEKLVEKNK